MDDKKCFFTGDNFYHVRQYTGSGGWSGLNRGLPAGYVRSTQRVLDARPTWVLAEHGGAFEFNAGDFRRRLLAQEAEKAAAALCPSGEPHQDWDPHRIRVEPFLVTGIPGRTVRVEVVAANPLNVERRLRIAWSRPEVVQAPRPRHHGPAARVEEAGSGAIHQQGLEEGPARGPTSGDGRRHAGWVGHLLRAGGGLRCHVPKAAAALSQQRKNGRDHGRPEPILYPFRILLSLICSGPCRWNKQLCTLEVSRETVSTLLRHTGSPHPGFGPGNSRFFCSCIAPTVAAFVCSGSLPW